MAPTCFGLFGPSSGSIRWNLAKVTVSLKSSVKIKIVKIVAVQWQCKFQSVHSVCWVLCGLPHSTQCTMQNSFVLIKMDGKTTITFTALSWYETIESLPLLLGAI